MHRARSALRRLPARRRMSLARADLRAATQAVAVRRLLPPAPRADVETGRRALAATARGRRGRRCVTRARRAPRATRRRRLAALGLGGFGETSAVPIPP